MQKSTGRRLTMFLQTATNPAVVKFIKINKLISELAYSLDLDPDELLNDPEEAAMMAQIIGMQNAGQATGMEAGPIGQEQEGMGAAGGVPQQPQNLELRVLVAATSEQEMFRSQGKMSLLGRLLELPQVSNEVLENG